MASANRSRRRGKGSLQSYQTKAGQRWRFQIWIPIDPEDPDLGEKKFSRGGFTDADAADDAMQEALRKRKNDEKFHGSVPTLGVYGAEWLDSLSLEASTMLGYRRQFRNYLLPHLGEKPVDKITGVAIGKLYRLLRERGGKDGAPLSANTVNKTSITLAAILDAAMEDGFLNKNPARLKKIVKAPKAKDIRAERTEMVTWSASELKSFLNWNRDTYEDDHFELWLTLANTGMRRGEAIALQWKDVDFAGARISIRRSADSTTRDRTKTPKSGKPRVVDVDDQLVAALKSLKALRGSLALDLARPTAYIFGHDDGRLRSPVLITNRWLRRTTAARKVLTELPHIPLHALRHTHATLLLEAGVPLKVVSERLGHGSIAITADLYSHVTQTMQRSAVEKFAALMNQGLAP